MSEQSLAMARARLLALYVHSKRYWGPAQTLETTHDGTTHTMTNDYHPNAWPSAYYFHVSSENEDVLWVVAKSMFGLSDGSDCECLLDCYDSVMEPIRKRDGYPEPGLRNPKLIDNRAGNLTDRHLTIINGYRERVLRYLMNPSLLEDEGEEYEDDGEDDEGSACCTPKRLAKKGFPYR